MLDYRINQSSPEAFFEYGKELLQTDSEKALGFFYRSFSGGFKEAKIFIDSIEGSFKEEFVHPSSFTSFQDLLEGVVSGKFSNSIEANYRVFKEAFSLKEKDVYEKCVRNICTSSENPENKTEILKGVYETLKTLNDESEIRFLEMIRETGVSDFGSGELLDFYRKTPGKYTDLELACAEYRYKYLKVPEAVLDVAEMVHFQKKDLLALSMLSGVVEGEYPEDIKTRANRLRDRIKMVVSGEVDVDWLTTEELERELYYGGVSGVAEGWSSLIQRKRSLDKRILDGILRNWDKFDDLGKEECFYCVRNMADELGEKGKWNSKRFVDNLAEFIDSFYSERDNAYNYIPARVWYAHDIINKGGIFEKGYSQTQFRWLEDYESPYLYPEVKLYVRLEWLEHPYFHNKTLESRTREIKRLIEKERYSNSFKQRAKKVRGYCWQCINEEKERKVEEEKRLEEQKRKNAEEEKLLEEYLRERGIVAEKHKLREYHEKCQQIESDIVKFNELLSDLNIEEAGEVEKNYFDIWKKNEVNNKYRKQITLLRERLSCLRSARYILKTEQLPTQPPKTVRDCMQWLMKMCEFSGGSDKENEMVAKALCKGAAWAEKYYESHLMLQKAAELGNDYAVKKTRSPIYQLFGIHRNNKYFG